MALKHGSTTITVLKHGSTTITTCKHGSTTVFTSGSTPTPSWNTVYSGSFSPNDNETDQQVCSIPSGTTNVRVTLSWWSYYYDDNSDDQWESEEVVTFSTSDIVEHSGYGLGQSYYSLFFSNSNLYVDSSVQDGEYGLYYIEITKVEAYY